jgi:hypothetical protein
MNQSKTLGEINKKKDEKKGRKKKGEEILSGNSLKTLHAPARAHLTTKRLSIDIGVLSPSRSSRKGRKEKRESQESRGWVHPPGSRYIGKTRPNNTTHTLVTRVWGRGEKLLGSGLD